jgi:hypothetical protein
MKNFALKHNQKIIMFSTQHTRLFSHEIHIDELLKCFDHVEISSAELFFYIKNVSITLLSNLNSALRLMNECREYMNDIVFESNNKNFCSY